MDITRSDIAIVDLDVGTVHRSFLNKALAEGDNNSVRFGVEVVRSGVPVTLTGCSCVGYFIRANGTTVPINGGSVSGNVATVKLPSACFAVEGNFTLAIKVTGSNATTTTRIVDGTVVNTVLGPIVDDGTQVQTSAEIEAMIEQLGALVTSLEDYSVTAELITGSEDDYCITVVTPEEEEA